MAKYKIYAKDRRRNTNLNVNSPPPETLSYADTSQEALKIKREKLKDYHNVKIVKVNL